MLNIVIFGSNINVNESRRLMIVAHTARMRVYTYARSGITFAERPLKGIAFEWKYRGDTGFIRYDIQ